MNSRHVAALAMMGWYLMLPPLVDPVGDQPDSIFADESGQIYAYGWIKEADLRAPLSTWRRGAKVLDSQSACEAARSKLLQIAEAGRQRAVDHPDKRGAQKLARFFGSVVCVSADDPRLKP